MDDEDVKVGFEIGTMLDALEKDEEIKPVALRAIPGREAKADVEDEGKGGEEAVDSMTATLACRPIEGRRPDVSTLVVELKEEVEGTGAMIEARLMAKDGSSNGRGAEGCVDVADVDVP